MNEWQYYHSITFYCIFDQIKIALVNILNPKKKNIYTHN